MNLCSRAIFLKTIALGVTLTLLGVAIKPTMPVSVDREVPFPQTLSLPGWDAEFTQAIALPPSDSRYHRIRAGQQYGYRQGDRTLQVTVRDVVETEGDIDLLMANAREFVKTDRSNVVDRQSNRGFYRLLTEQNQAYLQSCLNLNGYATVTATQFRQNAYMQALQPQQWFGWLLSQRALLERRCLWVQMSMPIVERDAQGAYATLEENWKALVANWRSNR